MPGRFCFRAFLKKFCGATFFFAPLVSSLRAFVVSAALRREPTAAPPANLPFPEVPCFSFTAYSFYPFTVLRIEEVDEGNLGKVKRSLLSVVKGSHSFIFFQITFWDPSLFTIFFPFAPYPTVQFHVSLYLFSFFNI